MTIQKLFALIACTFLLSPAWSGTNITSFGNDSVPHNGYRVMQISFVPNFGTNGFAGDSIVNDISLNILAGSVYEVRALEIGSLVNVVQRNSNGCEIAGIGNFVGGNMSGFQCAGLINTVNGMTGLQTAGLLNRAINAKGLQIAGLMNYAAGGPVTLEHFRAIFHFSGCRINQQYAIGRISSGWFNE